MSHTYDQDRSLRIVDIRFDRSCVSDERNSQWIAQHFNSALPASGHGRLHNRESLSFKTDCRISEDNDVVLLAIGDFTRNCRAEHIESELGGDGWIPQGIPRSAVDSRLDIPCVVAFV